MSTAASAVPKEVFGRDYFVPRRGRTALLVIDMQNSFVAEGAVFEAPNGRQIVPVINRLVEAARALDLPVVWTQSDHSPPGGGLILQRYPIIRETTELWAGDPTFDLYREMIEPVEGEHRVVKHKYDAFHDTDLDTALRNLRVDTVIICGVATEVCCESTARAAFFREYQVVFLVDATAAFDPEVQETTCARMDHLFARAMTTDELLDELSEPPT
jgi:ureidoacrylate peracid hydrolase